MAGPNRVLMVAYYFPPLGMAGVQRPYHFARYLPEFGWEPLILTVKDIAYYARDPRLAQGIQNMKVFRAESLDFSRILYLLGKKQVQLSLRNERLSRFTLNFFLFPDARVPWLPFAVALGSRIVRQFQPQALYSVSPPYTTHLVALMLKERFKIPWIADFTDLWPTGHRVPSPLHRSLNARLRRLIVRKADVPLKVYQNIDLGPRAALIEHGYDPEMFNLQVAPKAQIPGTRPGAFVILYTGVLADKGPGVWAFLRALKRVEGFQLVIAGEAGAEVHRFVGQEGLKERVVFLGYVPHEQVPRLMLQADALWFVFPYESASMKLYEYIGSGKPILFQAPPWSEASRVARKSESVVFLPNQEEQIVRILQEIRPLKGLRFSPPREYSRRFQARQLAAYLDRIARHRASRTVTGPSSSAG